MNKKKRTNPFYVLLLVAGCAFSITACAFGAMTVRELGQSRIPRTSIDEMPQGGEDFNELVDKHGLNLMVIELVILGIGTFGAIAYDQHLDGTSEGSSNDLEHEREATT